MVYTIVAIIYNTTTIDKLADFDQKDGNIIGSIIHLAMGINYVDFRMETIVRVLTEINLGYVCLLEFNYCLYLFNYHKVIYNLINIITIKENVNYINSN